MTVIGHEATDPAHVASSLVEQAARYALANRLAEAAVCLGDIDRDALWASRARRREATALARRRVPASVRRSRERGAVSLGTIRSVLARDGYVCRYCARRTIDIDVLKALSRLFPDVLPRHRNWKKAECHPIYWTHVGSLEHLTPVTHGGTDDPESNLICACYECNDARSNALLADLGWKPLLRKRDDWDGLAGLATPLLNIARRVGDHDH